MGCVQRITANAGNRRLIRGGILHRPTPTLGALGKALVLAAVIITPDLPEPPAPAPAARKRKGAGDDV
jgi:hypothetical protein